MPDEHQDESAAAARDFLDFWQRNLAAWATETEILRPDDLVTETVRRWLLQNPGRTESDGAP